MFKVSALFRPTMEAKEKVIVHQGGRRSTKSFTILQVFVDRSMCNKDQVRVIIGKDLPHMKRGILLDIKRLFSLYPEAQKYLMGGSWKQGFNISESKLYFKSGSQIIFAAFADQQDAKMTNITDFYMVEANLIKDGYGIYNQMMLQCEGQGFIDYNSMCPFWVHNKLIGKPDVRLFISDHRHNPFLSKEQHDIIENQYPRGSEQYKVYARGLTGKMEGQIYQNWHKITGWMDSREVFWGVDYGYSIGKTAIIKIGRIDRRKLCVQLITYKPGISADDIKKIMVANGYVSGQILYSEHDAEKISELRRLGMNVVMARKGELCEWNGILKVQEFEVYYVYCEELHTELYNYQWETVTSLESGEDILTQSVKNTKDYHAMAALRYGVYTHTFGN